MIYNFAEGTPEAPTASVPFGLDGQLASGGFQVDDPSSPDIGFVTNIVTEMFYRSAASIYVHPRTMNGDINSTFDEDPDPTYWPKIPLKAYFPPQPMEYELTKWGADLKNKLEATFLRSDVLTELGQRLLKPGDLLEVPYNSLSDEKPKYYRVVNAQETGNYRYQWFYVKTHTELIPGDITIRPPTDEQLQINDFPNDL